MSYADIMERYLVDLAAAREASAAWWNELLDAASPDGDVEAAQKAVRARWPLGPVSHPRVIAVFRQYYLETEAYNEEKSGADARPDPEGTIDPGRLLLDGLEAYDTELSAFMQGYLFTSIGTDPDGNIA